MTDRLLELADERPHNYHCDCEWCWLGGPRLPKPLTFFQRLRNALKTKAQEQSMTAEITPEKLVAAFLEKHFGCDIRSEGTGLVAYGRIDGLRISELLQSASVSDGLVERVFAEDLNRQSERLGITPIPTESPGHWRDRVRKAALSAKEQPHAD